jgi:hypothetical protein
MWAWIFVSAMKNNAGIVVLAVVFIAMFFALSGYLTGHAIARHQDEQPFHDSSAH